MSFSNYDDPKIKQLEKDIKQLQEEYDGLCYQARNALTFVERRRLKGEAEMIYDELRLRKEELKEQKEINQKTPSEKKSNLDYLMAKEKLLKFDYKKAYDRFFQIIDKYFAYSPEAGIFVLESCSSNGGKYCSHKLIHYLTQETSQGNFFLRSINPMYGENNEKGFLQQLAISLQINQNSEIAITTVVKKIHSLFGNDSSGAIHLFHVWGYDYLGKQESFWEWFLNQFWIQLTQELPNHPYLKLIFLFELDIKIPLYLEQEYICNSISKFNKNKIVKLPLPKCKKEEIQKWLYTHSGLSRTICDREMEIILEEIELKPDLVYDRLEKLLTL